MPPDTTPPTIGMTLETPLAKVSFVSLIPNVFRNFFKSSSILS